MKILVLFTAMMSFAIPLQANVGFKCEKSKMEISREVYQESLTLLIKDSNSRVIKTNPNLVLPAENSTDAYQDRYGTYYMLMQEAHLSFPYMPEGLMVYHVMRSTPLYKKGFKAFEGQGEAVKLPELYCKIFISAIERY